MNERVGGSGPRVPESVGSFVEAAPLQTAIRDAEPQVWRPQPSATDGRLVVPLSVPVLERPRRAMAGGPSWSMTNPASWSW